MRVAFFTESYHPVVSGVVVSVDTFTRELRARGAQVRIVAPHFPGYSDSDPDVFRVPALNLPTNPRYPLGVPWWPAAERAVAAWQADVIHVHGPFLMGALGARTARRLGLPLVFTAHTRYDLYTHYIPLPAPLTRWLARTITRRFANACNCVVAPSAGFAQDLRDEGVTSRVEVLCTGVDLSTATAPDPAERAHWGVPADAPLLLYVGRLALEKNIDLLLAAFARLSGKPWLLLVGGGPYERAARRLAETLGLADRVRFAGYVPHGRVFSLAAAADLFVFPSVTDTQGIVILEAMSQGLPCVCVDSPAIAGVVEQGRNGLVVKDDAAALATAIDQLLADGPARAAMAAQARLTAAANSSACCSERLLDLYRSLTIAPEG